MSNGDDALATLTKRIARNGELNDDALAEFRAASPPASCKAFVPLTRWAESLTESVNLGLECWATHFAREQRIEERRAKRVETVHRLFYAGSAILILLILADLAGQGATFRRIFAFLIG